MNSLLALKEKEDSKSSTVVSKGATIKRSPSPPRPPKKKISYVELNQILEKRASFEELDKIVVTRRDGNAEALFVKFNPKGEIDPNYTRRNKNRYLIVAKATIDIHRRMVLDILRDLKII